MDSNRNDGTGFPPELIALQEKALDFAIEKGRADLLDRRRLTNFFMAIVGLSFVALLVMLVPVALGAALPQAYFYVLGRLATPTLTAAGCGLLMVASALSGAGRRGAGASLLLMGRSALGNIRRVLGSGLGMR
ncbi:MAG TPA: hypothetical protein VF736_14385 [Pyrinomonadaceae bacterium]